MGRRLSGRVGPPSGHDADLPQAGTRPLEKVVAAACVALVKLTALETGQDEQAAAGVEYIGPAASSLRPGVSRGSPFLGSSQKPNPTPVSSSGK